MIITWDEPKRIANLHKHGIDFLAVKETFFSGAFVIPAANGRYKAVGRIDEAIIAVVVFAPLGMEAIALISLRRANRMERKLIDGA